MNPHRQNPLFSACGLHCGLCPRYYTGGGSRCPGCGGENFAAVHPPCGVLSCSQRRGLEYCWQCEAYPCGRYDGADASDSFITHFNQLRDNEKAKAMGAEAYQAEQDEKIAILRHLLAKYNNGRQKSFYCAAVNLLELDDLKLVMEQLDGSNAAALLQAMADRRGISLKLRKKQQ